MWSVRDMLRLAIGQTWTFAHDYQTVRSSSTERFDYVTVHPDTIRAPRITRSIPDVIRYTTWTAKLVRVSPFTGCGRDARVDMIRPLIPPPHQHHLTQTATTLPRAFLTGEDVLSTAALVRYAGHRVRRSPRGPSPGGAGAGEPCAGAGVMRVGVTTLATVTRDGAGG